MTRASIIVRMLGGAEGDPGLSYPAMETGYEGPIVYGSSFTRSVLGGETGLNAAR